MTGRNTCAMSKDCEGKEADRGLMCAEHRAEDVAIHEACDYLPCQQGLTHIAPCQKDDEA